MPYKDVAKQRLAQREYAARKYQNIRATRAALRTDRTAYIRARKAQPCADCHQTFHPVCMDFDHVRGTKLGDLSKMANDCKTYEAIDIEIAKCDVVCANCHRLRTAERHGWPGM